jgi:hypothetical protein
MLHLRMTLVAFALALSLGLAACGDDSSEDEDDISAAIETVATEDDPSTCTELQTESFVSQTSGSLEACEQDPSAEAESVEVSNVEVDGDSATADAAFTGGFLDGQTVTIGLANEDDQWKLDSLDGFAEFDRDTFVAGFEEELTGPDAPPAQIQDCLRQQLEQASDEELQDILLTREGGNELFSACVGGE